MFSSHLIDTTIFQTKSFDVLSEFALLVSIATYSAYFALLSRETSLLVILVKLKLFYILTLQKCRNSDQKIVVKLKKMLNFSPMPIDPYSPKGENKGVMNAPSKSYISVPSKG